MLLCAMCHIEGTLSLLRDGTSSVAAQTCPRDYVGFLVATSGSQPSAYTSGNRVDSFENCRYLGPSIEVWFY